MQNITTYLKLTTIFNCKKIKQRNACGNCGISLIKDEKCTNEECIHFYQKPRNLNKEETIITEFNIKHDLKLILSKYWSDIAQYKLELARNKISDICNSVSYKSKQLARNSISLIFFI